MEQFYEECCINPASVDYIEPHATGTKVSLLILGRYIMAWNYKLFEELLIAVFFWIHCSCFFSKCVSKFWLLACHYKFNFLFFILFWIPKIWILNYSAMKISENIVLCLKNDTNSQKAHSCAMFKDPGIIIRKLCCCGTFLSKMVPLLWIHIPMCSQQVTEWEFECCGMLYCATF